jgi:peroxiredoxin
VRDQVHKKALAGEGEQRATQSSVRTTPLRAITDEHGHELRIKPYSKGSSPVTNELNFGIPNVQLPWSSGGTVNPSCFAGHQLVVLFLPADPALQTAELASYERVAADAAGTDAWLLAVGENLRPDLAALTNIPIAADREGAAWRAFEKVARAGTGLDRNQGAAFLFTRGGAFHRAWSGQGHATEVIDELLTRA